MNREKIESDIQTNYREILDKIESACARGDRNPEHVRLIGVCKRQPEERIEAAIACGITLLGDNLVQELVKKMERFGQDTPVEWHFVGRLQRNKVKYLIPRVSLIHSVDSLPLLQEIDKRSSNAGSVTSVLIQVNQGAEEEKGGLGPEGLKDFVAAATQLSSIRLKGLMTHPPLCKDPEENRHFFKELRSLLEEIRREFDLPEFTELSMGTTQDYEIAVEEGSTMVRLGTELFGERVSDGDL